MKRWPALVLAALIPSACLGSPAGASVDGRTFVSTRVTEGGGDRPLVRGTQIRLAFRDGNLSASAGCNSMSGTYRVADGTLQARINAMTDMGCDDERFRQDDWLAGFLRSNPAVLLSGNDLALRSGATTITLVDRVIAEPDLPLVGTTWTVTSILAGDTASSVPNGVVATLKFGAEGRVEVGTGCNSGTAAYTSDGTTLRFGPLALTKRACLDPGATAMEEAIIAVVAAGSADYAIDGEMMTIIAGERGLQLRGAS